MLLSRRNIEIYVVYEARKGSTKSCHLILFEGSLRRILLFAVNGSLVEILFRPEKHLGPVRHIHHSAKGINIPNPLLEYPTHIIRTIKWKFKLIFAQSRKIPFNSKSTRNSASFSDGEKHWKKLGEKKEKRRKKKSAEAFSYVHRN